MTVDRIVHVFAGCMVLLSLALAVWVSQWWLLLTTFVGVNLLQSGLTRWCLLSSLLRRFGVRDDGAAA
jgi:hypothetical protein